MPLIKKDTKRTAAQLRKQYYYTAYYFCPNCHKIYLSDEFKIVNKNFGLFAQSEFSPTQFDIDIWTDGASRNNGQDHAKAAWAFVAGKHEENGEVDGRQTNNRAEALAIYHALLWAVKKGYKKIKIHTDSQITIHGVLKHHEKVKENQDIFARISGVISGNHLLVTYEKVLGHSGDLNNERADKLANSLAVSP